MNSLAEKLKEDIPLEEKLKIIDDMMMKAQERQKAQNIDVPIDPMEYLSCESCQ